MIPVASWLLRTFGSGPSIETLIGDLTEEHQGGKSVPWFWGQAMLGIATTLVAEIRGHKLLSLRAVAMALVLMTMFTITVGYVEPWIVAATEVYLPTREPFWASTYSIVNGVRLAGDQRVPLYWHPFVYQPVILLVLNILGALFIGALVRRTHRSMGAASVLFSVAALALLFIGQRLYIRPSLPEGAPRIDLTQLPWMASGWWMAWSLWIGGTMVAFMLGGLAGYCPRSGERPVGAADELRPEGAP